MANEDLQKQAWAASWGTLSTNLNKWACLNLDLDHKVKILQWHVLSHVLYLQQSLWHEVTAKEDNQLRRIMSKFVWDQQKPRMAWEKLMLPTKIGGMNVPNLRQYGIAVMLMRWIQLQREYS